MAARLTAALLAALLLAATAPAAISAGASSASAASDQGSDHHYSSSITAVTPSVPGLGVQVLEFADRLLLSNHTGQTVTVYGYQGEPYARVLPDGTAEQNTRSPATYLNASFYGNVSVPAYASPSAAPRWAVVDRTGRFEWHDHRIHWNSPLLPPQVKDRSRRTLIFDWQVPIAVGAQRGAIAGQLVWVPESSKTPVAAIVLGVAIALAGVLFVFLVRRRRAAAPPAGGRPGAHEPGGPPTGGSDPARS